MESHNFRELKVWQQARELVKELYVLSAAFPAEEQFGFKSQLRRAAVSIPSNIAEGSGRGDKEFVRFLGIALSSAYEAETQLILSADLQFIDNQLADSAIVHVQEVQRMLYGLQRKLTKGFLASLWLPIPTIARTLSRWL